MFNIEIILKGKNIYSFLSERIVTPGSARAAVRLGLPPGQSSASGTRCQPADDARACTQVEAELRGCRTPQRTTAATANGPGPVGVGMACRPALPHWAHSGAVWPSICPRKAEETRRVEGPAECRVHMRRPPRPQVIEYLRDGC